MLSFQHPLMLAALILVVIAAVIFFIAAAKKKKAIKNLGDRELVDELLLPYKQSSYFQKFSLIALSLAALIVALANLRTPAGAQRINRNGIDVMIALDVSKSMLAQDIQPNRLERAKQLLSKIIDKLEDDRIGIVVFAGRAYIQMPISADHSSAKMYLNAASTETVPTQGTVLGEALKMCNASFNPKEKKYKSIILVSDGEDHDEDAVDIAKALTKEGVSINTVGMGSQEGTRIVDNATGEVKTDENGNQVITKLNAGLLQEIAKNGNGTFQLLGNTETVAGNIVKQISTMDQRAVRDDSLMNYNTLFQWIAGLALLLLLTEFFMSEVRRNKKTKTATKPVAAMIFILFSFSSFAQNEKEFIRSGNEFFKQKNYPAAVGEYQKALQIKPGDPVAEYNMANAYYKGGKKDEAIKYYDNTIKNFPQLIDKSKAYYNKGVVLQNTNKIDECIEAYKSALRINPADDDARQNLQKALRKKQQDKQNQDNKNKEKEQNQDQQKNNSKLNKQEAENKLKALMQQENQLQDKLHKSQAESPLKPQKDW